MHFFKPSLAYYINQTAIATSFSLYQRYRLLNIKNSLENLPGKMKIILDVLKL